MRFDFILKTSFNFWLEERSCLKLYTKRRSILMKYKTRELLTWTCSILAWSV